MLIREPGENATKESPKPRSILRIVFGEWAAQDFVVFTYLTIFFLAVVAGSGPRRPAALAFTSFDAVVFGTLVTVGRNKWFGPKISAVVYRVALLFGLLGSFFQLQWILPTARGAAVDAQLYAFDLKVFGMEPADVFDKFTNPQTTEWFAFFYWGYFPVLAAHVLPFLFGAKPSRRLSEISFGVLWVFSVAHCTYLLVPGFGPYIYLADHFTHRLEGATFWPLVKATVDSVDITSRTDIFPSLHTAAPTFLATFAFRHRKTFPFKYTWAPTMFAVSQIIIATMFLRWHYLIDVCVGFVHGVSTAFIAAAVAGREDKWRASTGRSPVWTTPWRGDKDEPEADQEEDGSTVSDSLVRPSLEARSASQAPEPRSSSRQTAGRRS